MSMWARWRGSIGSLWISIVIEAEGWKEIHMNHYSA